MSKPVLRLIEGDVAEIELDAVRANELHRLAKYHQGERVRYGIECGNELIKIRENMGREFVAFILRRCDFGLTAAYRYIDAAEKYSHGVKISSLRSLSMSKTKLCKVSWSEDATPREVAQAIVDKLGKHWMRAFQISKEMGKIARAIAESKPHVNITLE